MKTRQYIYAALVLTSLLASCSKDFTSMADTDAPLEMKLQPVLAGETKASMQTSDLTEFWLQVENPQDPAYNYFTKVTKSGTDWNPADHLFWKNSSASVNYCASYFGSHNFTQEEFTNGVNLTVPADQRYQSKLNSADLLILKSTSTTYQATTNGQLPVELTHGLSKVNFVITLGDAFFDALIGLLYNPVRDFTVIGVNTGFNFKPQTGAVTVKSGTEENIRPLECDNYSPSKPTAKTATANYEAILVPQTFAKGGLKVTFKIGKGTYEWTNTSAITLEAGKTYNLPISVTSAPPIETHNGRVYVDMGLSVKWATCNVGATTPFESGDYFAWGETEPYYESLNPLKWREDKKKFGYEWSNYKWGDNLHNLAKYCDSDKKTTLDPEDDAATAKWGGSWRMPTQAEWEELSSRSYKEWKTTTEGYPYDGLLLISKINNNSIFLPAAGYYLGLEYHTDNYYWSSTRYKTLPGDAIITRFEEDYLGRNSLYRCYGLPVRPVCP